MAVFSSSLISRDRAPRANGLVTLLTCGTAFMRRTDSSTARFAAGSSSVPCAAWNTTGLWPFCCGGNSLARKSVAACVSVPGRRMSFEVRAPSSTQPVATTATTHAHTSSTSHAAPGAEGAESIEKGGHAAGILPVAGTGILTIRTPSRVST